MDSPVTNSLDKQIACGTFWTCSSQEVCSHEVWRP